MLLRKLAPMNTLIGSIVLGAAALFSATSIGLAEPLREAELRDAVADTQFQTFQGPLSGEISFAADGYVQLSSDFGAFQGKWSSADELICMYFENGPLGPVHCFGLNAYPQSFGTTHGTLLVPLAQFPQTVD